MEKRKFTTTELLIASMIEQWYCDGVTTVGVQEKLHEALAADHEYNEDDDRLLDFADALYGNIYRGLGHYQYDQTPFVEPEKSVKLPPIKVSFDNLRPKTIHSDEDASYRHYGFLDLPHDDQREAWAMMLRHDRPEGEEGNYYESMMHAFMYPRESRLTSRTDNFDEIEDFWVNFCECQWRKVEGSHTMHILEGMIEECIKHHMCEYFAFNLMKARNLLYYWCEEDRKQSAKNKK